MEVRGSDPESIGQHFAAAVRKEPAAERLWIGAEPNGVSVWLLTSAIPLEAERPFNEASALLEEAFPEANVSFHLLNIRHFCELNPARYLPSGIVEIPLD